MSLGYRQL